MQTWLIIVLIVLAILIGLAARWLYGIWRLAGFITLLTPEILESVPFFELVDLLAGGSHALERHSPMTRFTEHVKRANEGITPEGIPMNAVASGRWYSYHTMLQAVEAARVRWLETGKKEKACYVFRFTLDIGYVVEKNTKNRVDTPFGFVVINKKGVIVTAFPVLHSESMPARAVDIIATDKHLRTALTDR